MPDRHTVTPAILPALTATIDPPAAHDPADASERLTGPRRYAKTTSDMVAGVVFGILIGMAVAFTLMEWANMYHAARGLV